jgi:prolipoprotein diacylglyceryltransferase
MSWYFVGYAFGRFNLEYWRTDMERLYLKGFSDAQWLTGLISLLVAALQLGGVLVVHVWDPTLAAGTIVVMGAVATFQEFRRHGFERFGGH